jgi:hypothetical protein
MGLMIIEIMVKRTAIRVASLLLIMILVAGVSMNVGRSIGQAMESNALSLHIRALFNRLATLAREDKDEALKRDILRFHKEMSKAFSDEALLAEVVGEIENSPSEVNDSAPDGVINAK